MRITRCGYLALSLSGFLFLAGPVRGASWSEGSNGDLSGTVGAPSTLTLDPGANLVTATSGGGDFDLLAFSVPNGHQLDSIFLTSYGGLRQSFTGIQSGGTWGAGLGGAVNPAGILGWSHYGPASAVAVGTNMLDNISTGAGAIGFTPPLGTGTYTQLFQETGGAESFSVTYNVSAVPEPSSLALLVAAALVGGAWRLRGRRVGLC